MKEVKAGGRWCAAFGCRANDNVTKISFFKFPKDLERCKQWIANSGRSDLVSKMEGDPLYCFKNCRLCIKHFEDRAFANFLRNRLKPDAVPTIFNWMRDIDSSEEDESTIQVDASSNRVIPSTSQDYSTQKNVTYASESVECIEVEIPKNLVSSSPAKQKSNNKSHELNSSSQQIKKHKKSNILKRHIKKS